MATKRSFEEFRLLYKYLKSKKQTSEYGHESQVDEWIEEMSKSQTWVEPTLTVNEWIKKMMELIQPKYIKEKYNDQVLKVVQAFIADGKWKCTAWFSEKWERLKSRLPNCECRCKEKLKSCLLSCRRWLKNHAFYWCCKDTGYKVLLKQQKDGSIIQVRQENEEESFINRSFEDFYYLHTYLQAKYPNFKWPSLPLHNVLTIAEQRHLTKMREEFISDMVQLLQPNVWRHHSEIEKVMQTFTAEEEWQGSKFFSRFRMYILFHVNSAGHQTGPDLVAFIVFCIGYSLFVFIILHDKWDNGKLLYFVLAGAIILAFIVIYQKNESMKPPILWHTRAKIKGTDRDDQDQTIVKQTENPGNRSRSTTYETFSYPKLQELQPNTTGNKDTSPLVTQDV